MIATRELNLRHMIVQYQQTGFDKPRRCEHKLLKNHDEFASIDGVVLFLWGECLGDAGRQVVAEVLSDLICRNDNTSKGNLVPLRCCREPENGVEEERNIPQ